MTKTTDSLAQNDESSFLRNSNEAHIGAFYNAGAGSYFDGYMAEIFIQDGVVITDPFTDGYVEIDENGVYRPLDLSGKTFGTQGGLYLGSNSADLGEESTGNGNDFTSSGLAAADQMLDTPTNNFCTLNPVEPNWGGAVTLSDGNLALAGTSSTVWNNAVATFKTLPSTGKWIWASEPNTYGRGRGDPWIVNETGLLSKSNPVYTTANGWEAGIASTSLHSVLHNNVQTNASFSYGAGDFSVVCFDADSKKLWFGLYDVSAGTLQFRDGSTGFTGDPAAGTDPTFTLTGNEFSIGFSTYTGQSGVVDFGQSNLLSQITIPTGFQTLCTANLPDPTIADPSAYFQTLAYASTGTSTAFVQDGNSQFEPGLVWVKSRTGANNHLWFDQVRGATKFIRSDTTNTENTVADTLTAFNSNGFTAGADSVNWGINYPGRNNVAWMWAADGTSGSSNTDGSITSTVSANTTSGFSIVQYTGNGTATQTVGHGLGVTPGMVIIKKTSASGNNWQVWHQNLSATSGKLIELNTTTAEQSSTTIFETAPTSSVFGIGSASAVNASGATFIAYCFAEVDGFSKFGSFTGNGSSTDGPFIYTGFTPEFFMWKRTDSGTYGDWTMLDTKRDPFNMAEENLRANSSMTGDTGEANLDFVSNGIKHRGGTSARFNQSGATYVYMAFAESPFKTATAR